MKQTYLCITLAMMAFANVNVIAMQEAVTQAPTRPELPTPTTHPEFIARAQMLQPSLTPAAFQAAQTSPVQEAQAKAYRQSVRLLNDWLSLYEVNPAAAQPYLNDINAFGTLVENRANMLAQTRTLRTTIRKLNNVRANLNQ